MKKTIAIFFSICFFSSTLLAQSLSDSLEFIPLENPVNILSNNFNKQLNTYSLYSNLYYNTQFKDVILNLSEDYNSTFVKSAEKSIRDENHFNLSGAYKINKIFQAGVAANNKIYSDSRKIEINQASQSDGTFFAVFKPEDAIVFSPFFGYTNNRQIGESDNGYLYGAEGYLNNLLISDFNLSSQLKFRNEDISPRKNSIRYYNFIVKNIFNENVSNSVGVKYAQNRKDFYFKADSNTAREFDIVNNIQSRIETSNIIQDKLNYDNFLDIFSLDFLGNIAWRSIDRNTRYRSLAVPSPSLFDTKIDELKVELETMARYNSKAFNGTLRINYSERDEKHLTKNIAEINPLFYEERSQQESEKNNTAIRTTVALTGLVRFSPSDKLDFSLYQNKLKYNTPSTKNYDDRDEILSIVRFRYTKNLTPFFDAFVNTEGTYNHIVYIFSEKSSNNNVNRIIKLSAGGNYHGKYISSSNSFGVSANYTVYDFEDISPSYRSYSFRQYTALDSSEIKFTRDFSFVHYGYIKLSEQGDLKWASFSTKPTRYLEEIYSVPEFVVKYNKAELSLGLRYYALNTYNYKNNVKVIDTRYVSLAPLSGVKIIFNNDLYFKLYGWYEFITINSNVTKHQANFALNMHWNF